MSIYWNRAFTDMIRRNRPSLWGNWSLNANIDIGAIGYIDAESGDFTYCDVLQTRPRVSADVDSQWSMMSTNVRKSSGTTNIAGRYDPTTGTQVTVEAVVKWDFSETGEIVSTFQPAQHFTLANRGNTIAQQMNQITQAAQANGYMNGTDITQGFGVVTEVIFAEAGMNLGAQSSGSSFSMSGSVAGMAGMTDNDQAKASLKGSYFAETSIGSFDSHIWPANANEVATTYVPIAFVFSSFGPNNVLIPVWVASISEFIIDIDNAHGGTYVVDVSVTGNVNGLTKDLGKTKVSGGSSGSITGIPLSTLNLSAKLSFETGPTLTQSWPTPLSQIPTGEVLLDIYGVAPGQPSIVPHIVPQKT